MKVIISISMSINSRKQIKTMKYMLKMYEHAHSVRDVATVIRAGFSCFL